MTLVLPFGCDQIASNSLFSGSGSNPNSSMPCVFDSDAFDRDLESALMTDWTSDIADYEMPAVESPVKTPSDLKRKSIDDELQQHSLPKKVRLEKDDPTPPIQSEVVSSSNDSSLQPSHFSPMDSSGTSCSSSSEGGQDDETSDDMPRRRGPQMWNSRQRWKDERKKVLKMSINKLADIEDPELCLLRSVLINNTIKKLHLDIRNERQAKLRHRQQRIDFFADRFPPFSPSEESGTISECFTIDFSSTNSSFSGDTKTNITQSPPELHDDSSCDEMFGINEEFLRVPTDRRASSPIPTNQPRLDKDSSDLADAAVSPVSTNISNCSSNLNRNSSPSSSSCDIASSSFRTQNNSQTVGTVTTHPVFPHNKRPVPPLPSGGSQCAMQYRTNRDLGGDDSFPPRVPILDSVVYHSLLASLESS